MVCQVPFGDVDQEKPWTGSAYQEVNTCDTLTIIPQEKLLGTTSCPWRMNTFVPPSSWPVLMHSALLNDNGTPKLPSSATLPLPPFHTPSHLEIAPCTSSTPFLSFSSKYTYVCHRSMRVALSIVPLAGLLFSVVARPQGQGTGTGTGTTTSSCPPGSLSPLCTCQNGYYSSTGAPPCTQCPADTLGSITATNSTSCICSPGSAFSTTSSPPSCHQCGANQRSNGTVVSRDQRPCHHGRLLTSLPLVALLGLSHRH